MKFDLGKCLWKQYNSTWVTFIYYHHNYIFFFRIADFSFLRVWVSSASIFLHHLKVLSMSIRMTACVYNQNYMTGVQFTIIGSHNHDFVHEYIHFLLYIILLILDVSVRVCWRVYRYLCFIAITFKALFFQVGTKNQLQWVNKHYASLPALGYCLLVQEI